MECIAEDCGEIVYVDVVIEKGNIVKIKSKGDNLSNITQKVIDKMNYFEGKNAEQIMKTDKKELLKEMGFGDVPSGKRDFALLPIKAMIRSLEKTL